MIGVAYSAASAAKWLLFPLAYSALLVMGYVSVKSEETAAQIQTTSPSFELGMQHDDAPIISVVMDSYNAPPLVTAIDRNGNIYLLACDPPTNLARMSCTMILDAQ